MRYLDVIRRAEEELEGQNTPDSHGVYGQTENTDEPPLEYRPTGPTPWERLATMRWGPALGDPTPGIVIDVPNREQIMAAFERRRRPWSTP
jgi:hypothetical protein